MRLPEFGDQILAEADKKEPSACTLGGLAAALKITSYRVEELARSCLGPSQFDGKALTG
ncbi:MAG: hypothetical protein ACR2PH_18355 [Desulfobulbia bacterium]